jgi:hypothetical protein
MQAAAQLFSVPSNLDSTFSRTGDHLGLNPALFDSLVNLPVQTQAHLELGYTRADTIRTIRAGSHTGDVYGSGRFLDLRLGQTEGVSAQFWLSQSIEHGDSGNPGPSYLQGVGNDTDWAFRIQSMHGGAGYYAGYRRVESHGSFQSGTFTNLLPILSGTAQLDVDGYSTLVDLGAMCTVARRVHLEAAVGWETSPTAVTLSTSSHAVSVPADVSGLAWSLAATADVARRSQIVAYWQHADLAGDGPAKVDGEAIGEADNSATNREWGLGLRTRLDQQSELLLTYSAGQQALDAHANGIAPRPLGLSGATGAGYSLSGAMNRHETRVSWRHNFERRRTLEADLRYLDAPLEVGYGYSASYFIFSAGSSSSFSLSPDRALEIRLRYTMPVRRANLTVDIAQLAPVDVRTGQVTAGSGGPSNGPSSHSSGGWSVTVGMGIPF